MKVKKILGDILSTVGFLGLFAIAEDWTLQIICTLSATAMIIIGQKLLKVSGAFEEE